MGNKAAASEIAQARERALEHGEATDVRAPVQESWARAIERGVDPDRHLPPVPLDEDVIAAQMRDHPLRHVWPTMVDAFRGLIHDPGHVLFVSDAHGHLLWTEGDRSTLRQAERVHLVPGALWSEQGAATSAVGTTLVLDRPFQVFGPEHYLSIVTAYACSATPIRDPVSGRTLGTLDLTSSLECSRSLALQLVNVAGRLAEAQLRSLAERQLTRVHSRYTDRVSLKTGVSSALVTAEGRVLRSDPEGWLPPQLPGPLTAGPVVLPGGHHGLAEPLAPQSPFYFLIAQQMPGHDGIVPAGTVGFSALGLDRAWLNLDGSIHQLSARHSEIVALLSASVNGLGAEALAGELYGAGGKAVSVRAEMSRLRRILGHRLASDPYRLRGEVRADFIELDRHLGSLSVDQLLDDYVGPVLPGSRAPGVGALRAALHERVRARILAAADADGIARWTAKPHGRRDRDRALERSDPD